MDLDALMKRFRIASREIFNHYFHGSTHDGDGFDGLERFDAVEETLFCSMVTWPAGLNEVPYAEAQPEIGVMSGTGRDVPCFVSRKSGTWENDVLPLSAQLTFVRFFDWEELELKDNLYVWAEVCEWPSQADMKGIYVLVEAQYIRFGRVAA